jgi:hypothetical protein
MRWPRILFLLAFFAFTALPLANAWLGVVPEKPLVGVSVEVPPVPLNPRTYRNGKFQEAFEQRFGAGLSLRGHFVRADNELNLRAFHQTGLDPHTSMVIGKDDYIFERGYVDAFNRHDEVPAAELEKKVERLALLQRYLESRGSTLLVVITPSKPLLYPEYLPPKYVISERQSVPTNYDKFVPLLEKHRVHFVDGEGYLSAHKATSPVPYFGNSSSHWNDPAACEVTAVVMAQLGAQLQTRMPQLRCAPYYTSMAQRKKDIDILQVCNLWSEDRLYQPVHRARPRLVPRRAAPLSMLMIGGSFSFYLAEYFRLYRIDHHIFRYYTEDHYRGRKTPIHRDALNWDELFSKQVIVIEVNVEVVPQVGFGFLEDAEREIAARPAAVSPTL